MSEVEVIRRILAGEENLFARLVNQYSGFVWALCSSYVRNATDCEDVTQEVFVQCYRRLDTLRNPAAFGAWLSQLARRHCLMWLRTKTRREQRLTEYENGVEVGQGHMGEVVMDNPARDELHEGIREAIDASPPDYREALHLRFTEGYSVEEAASFLGISTAAMRKRLERAQQMLKDSLWDQVEPALAKRKHTERLAGGILAAIPFGKAPWLGMTGAGTATTTAAASKLATMGGIAVMFKKLIVGIGIVALLLGTIYYVAGKAGQRNVKTRHAVTAKTETAPVPTARVKATAVSDEKPVPHASVPAAASNTTTPKSLVQPVQSEPPASVSGRIQTKDAAPIAGADVYLEVAHDRLCEDVIKRYRTKTGADGRYEFPTVDVFGPAYIFASADGFVMQRDHVTVKGGGRLQNADLTLPAAKWWVAGRVLSDSKSPIPDASVDSLYFGYDEEGLAHTAATGQTTGNISNAKFVFALTDQNGAFRLAVPSPGLCDLRVTKEGYGHGFFPKILTGAEDAQFVLHAGGAIAGKVTTADGKPAPGATVRVTGQALPGGLTPSPVKIQVLPVQPVVVTTDADGAYVARGLGEDYVYAAVVPATDTVDVRGLPTDQGMREITGMMREFDEMIYGTKSVSALKTGIRVQAGQTTQGVDLVIGSVASATIHGTVTDKSSGKPVCPVVVTANSIDGGWLALFKKKSSSKYGGSAVTDLNGSYVLRIQDVPEKTSFRIGYEYMTEGGSAWEQPDEEIATLDLSPRDDHELNFSVDAPLVVPVRYVGTAGSPCTGILAAMRQAGGGGGCGGTLISGPDGRVTFHGIRPGVDLQAVAWIESGSDVQTIGVSDPFSGKAGETLPEVTVVCRLLGGVEGTLVYPDNRPVANAALVGGAQTADGSTVGVEGPVSTDGAGHFVVAEAFPEGRYANIAVGFFDDQSNVPYSVTLTDVEIAAGAISNLGTMVVAPEKDLLRVVAAVDWGHKANQAVAMTYTKEGLDALPDPSLILKTGMALYDAGRYSDALDVFRKLTETTERGGLFSAVSLVWQGQMLDLMGKRDEAIAAYTAAADMNVTDHMRHDQFGMDYSPKDYATQRIQEPFTRIENLEP